MEKLRCIGLVGGIGPGAAVHYYRKLVEGCARRGVGLELVMVHAETARVFAYARAGDREGMAEYLNGFVARMKAAGAEVAVIPAVTPHMCLRELEAVSALPVVDLFAPLRRELAARRVRRVGVLGTRFVVESGLFGIVGDVEVVRPVEAEVEYVHRTYTELAEAGVGTEAQYRGLTELAVKWCERDGVEAVVLGGTDLALIFDEGNVLFPYVDCAALHLAAVLEAVAG